MSQQSQIQITSSRVSSFFSISQEFFSYSRSHQRLLRPQALWQKQHGQGLHTTFCFLCWLVTLVHFGFQLQHFSCWILRYLENSGCSFLFFYKIQVSGACWYLLSVERQEACWRSACNLEKPFCEQVFLDCRWVKNSKRVHWSKSSKVTNICHPDNTFYQYGIYGDAVTNNITSLAFFNKYFYSLWWGLKNVRLVYSPNLRFMILLLYGETSFNHTTFKYHINAPFFWYIFFWINVAP